MSATDVTARIEAAERWRELAQLAPAFIAFACFALTLAALALFVRGRGGRTSSK